MASDETPQPGIWYLVGKFGFDLGKIYNRIRREDLDGQPLHGHSGLQDVWQGEAVLDGGGFAVYYGTTPFDFWSAPAGSIIWCLKS